MYRESRDIWQDYNGRQEFEHELINRKTTWLATAQTILFAAYGVTWEKSVADGAQKSAADGAHTFRNVVACAGLVVAVVTLVGVAFVIISKWLSWRRYRKFYKDHECYLPRPLRPGKLPWGVNTVNTFATLVPDVGLPLIFAVAWWILR